MVETIRLESGHTLTGIGGSNPSLSASHPWRAAPLDKSVSPNFAGPLKVQLQCKLNNTRCNVGALNLPERGIQS